MITIDNLEQVANQIENERGIAKELLFEAVEQALASACRKRLGDGSQLECDLHVATGTVQFFRVKEVVEDVFSESTEIELKEAKKLDEKAAIGGEVRSEFVPPDFGRIAAQVAKQVIMQRLREAEKHSVYDEFLEKVGTVVNGVVQQIENNNILVNLGRTEALLYYRDQIRGERFSPNDNIRVFVVGLDKENRRNMISISRTHPDFLKALFEMEIPEIGDGIINVMAVSRDPGVRSKVAVKTNNPSIGAVGTCVGQMGGRIRSIIQEFNSERIDVLEWDEDPKKFIANALKPATVSYVSIDNKDNKEATVVVPNDQLSLAIGKYGSNVRLSVALTGWSLNVVSEQQYADGGQTIGEQDTEGSVFSDQKSARDSEVQDEKNIEEAQKKLKQKIKAMAATVDDSTMTVAELAELLGMTVDEFVGYAHKKGQDIHPDTALTSEQVSLLKQGSH